MPGCTAPNCSNSSKKGFKLYHFPSDEERSALWVKNCGREEGWKPTIHTCVCEVHFEETQFESHRADGLRKLKPYAVPTKFNNLNNQLPIKRKLQNKVPRKGTFHNNKNPGKVLSGNPSMSETNKSLDNTSIGNSSVQKCTLVKKHSRQLSSKRMKYLYDNYVVHLKKRSKMLKKSSEQLENPEVQQKNEICFMCNEKTSNNVSLNSHTTTTNVRLDQKLIQLVAQEFELLVEDSGVICTTCAQILNFIDYVESVLSTLTKGILNRMRTKFGMKSSGDIDLLSYMKSLSTLHSFCLDKVKEGIHAKKHFEETQDSCNDKESCHLDQNEGSESCIVDKNFEKSPINFNCQLCTYQTKVKALMVYHLRQHVHSSYTCDFCSTPVTVKSRVKNIEINLDSMQS